MVPAILNAILTPVIKWPWRVIRLPVRLILVVAGVRKRWTYNLPVAGLEQAKAQGIIFTLRRAATTPQVWQHAEPWLHSKRSAPQCLAGGVASGARVAALSEVPGLMLALAAAG
jgi:hypothetical protein